MQPANNAAETVPVCTTNSFTSHPYTDFVCEDKVIGFMLLSSLFKVATVVNIESSNLLINY